MDGDYYGSGGGGFLTGTQASPSSASGSPGMRGRGVAAQSVRPVTVKQLYAATQAHTDAEWRLFGAEIGQVTVVAQVISIHPQATNNVYWLDDGSGRIEARHWITDSTSASPEDRLNGVTENAFARVTGTLKIFGNKRYINTTHVRPLEDGHELYFHILEVIYAQQCADHGPHNPIQSNDGGNDIKPNGGASASAYSAPSASGGGAAATQYAHLPPLQKRIAVFLAEQPQSDEGTHVGAIARTIGGDPGAISQAIEQLMDQGHIFSTVDESHFSLC